MNVGDLKKMLEQYPDDMEILVDRWSDYDLITDDEWSVVKAVPKDDCGYVMRPHPTMSEENIYILRGINPRIPYPGTPGDGGFVILINFRFCYSQGGVSLALKGPQCSITKHPPGSADAETGGIHTILLTGVPPMASLVAIFTA